MSAGPATKFVRRPWNFLGGVAHLQQLPLAMIPEVAFAGRSNVGKSSLINALAGDLFYTSVLQFSFKKLKQNSFKLV